jgi:hypothetical protein
MPRSVQSAASIGVEANTAIPDMHLKPITAVLDLMHPELAREWLFERLGREGWMKPGGASFDPT